ncbi:hypothetical protein S40288_09746 [Stachybotrys chartarum IBT 40288]|nr:hypothetical protein S40288_09746 [Stachybotrys chartarum IBT 40288]
MPSISSSFAATCLAVLLLVGDVHTAPQAVATPVPSLTPGGGSSGNAAATACNNSPELCSRRYNDMLHFGAHNSAFLRDASTDYSLFGNQYLNATVGLDAGLRLLQAQVHSEDGALRLCHSSCSLMDAGLLQDWLALIRAWMDGNPADVVTILLVNADDRPADEFGAAFQAAGLSRYGYTPPAASATADWPTLQTMIDQGTRLVSFVTNTQPSAAHPYILNEFDYVFETAFEVTELTGFNCTLDRPSTAGGSASAAVAANYLGLVNHFKYEVLIAGIMAPDEATLGVVNSPEAAVAGNMGLHLQRCGAEWARTPSFVLVDFWDEASPIAAVDQLNNLASVTGRRQSEAVVVAGAVAAVDVRNLGHGALLAFLVGVLLLV